MRKFKQLISVFLCAALCLSAFAISAQAKTKKKAIKKYVTSISVAKKATITIPANKMTAVKSYKVTVKVKNQASKAFTAKSSKTSVATVKVSGSTVKVTAKKAGKATITVTTKAKNSKSKKLSKKLTLTVKKKKVIVPASLVDVAEPTELKISAYLDGEKNMSSHIPILDFIIDADPNAAYYGESADPGVAAMTHRKTELSAVSEGTTTVDVFEQTSAATRKLGTITVVVKPMTMAEAASDAIMYYTGGDDFHEVKLKANFGKSSYDFDKIIKKILIGNEEVGSKFAEGDFTVTYSSFNDKIAAVSDDGIISAVKNGMTYVYGNLKFTDNSEEIADSTVNVTGLAIEKVEGYTLDNIRNYIVGIDTPIELADETQQPLINFDNAATTPAFKAVQDAINEELEMYGSIGRGYSQKSNHSTDVYNNVRDKVLEFF
ncbi:MAG: aminotransferase class V-fold PLP-dependent enzyme, partial [Ruminococcus sp.]|nr:aminotransferase class V-fold PLP-dependent enzyme [Ruminococcus sp.]